MRKVVTVFGCLLVLALVNCGSKDIGESCDQEGKVDGCGDNNVCAKNKTGDLVCAKQCSSSVDCGTTQTCNGGQGSLRACVDQ